MLFPVPDSDTLSDMLQSARKKLRLSQRQVAERTGMSQQNYARIEKNPGSVGFDTVLLVLAALGLDLQVDDRRHVQESGPDQAGLPTAVRPVRQVAAAVGVTGKTPAHSSGSGRTLPPGSIWHDETPEDF
ncbi:helix-turn-helix domain-containing protein [Silvimonas iriomotensis]|uniref:HTH cro/C1-type domain-containing protein n=1 Tax=Silvimonas iriomotensis TaxID=449662 RepID=A0ABQ2P5U0_9NEIS|nr:helix-turn-helix transcriptional regulator [Silvimonas iriomotensis]GGP18833.1 hypothetical protein GCM10010970_07620 [Silvimonas iriomotensis]